MITRQLSRRVTRIEKTLLPADDGMVTIEEFCRFMWRRDPAHCVELAKEPGDWIFRHYIPVFEAEDARRHDEELSRLRR
jgi:hypothetical protein